MTTGTSSRSELQERIEQYSQDRTSIHRSYEIPMSALRREMMVDNIQHWQRIIGEIDFETLGQAGKVDYLLFGNHLRYEARLIELEQEREKEIANLAPFWELIVALEENRRKMEPLEARTGAERLTELKKAVEKAREETHKRQADGKEIKKTDAFRTEHMLQSLRTTLKRWYDFYHGYDPLFTWWCEEPFREADKSIETYATYLRENVVGQKEDDEAVIGEPLGRAALLNELENAMIPYAPEELIAIGEKEFAWCEEEMIKASRELGYGDTWHKALEYVKTCHVEPGKQPWLIKELALEAIEYVEDKELISVPELARKTWRVGMMSPERQKVNPFFTGGEVISVSYPTAGMTQGQKLMSMRGNNKHFARATVHHELIPGHHLQGFMTARHKRYRRIFSTPFWGEGWPLYWEVLLWDLGFPKTPENRIGMLFWRMHRCARIVFSLSFHLEKMTARECIDYLVERVGHELENAVAEVRRSFEGNYSPLYQCAYMLGGLQMRALKKELVGSETMTYREFHDAVLKENSMPIEMLRALLTGQPLQREHKTLWRFYEA